MNKEEIRQFKSLLKQGSLRHMNIILDDKFQKSLLEVIKDYEEKDKQVDQLTNNWNELEECVESRLMSIPDDICTNEVEEARRTAKIAVYQVILGKMKEIEEGRSERG